jgi:hypothetical protein
MPASKCGAGIAVWVKPLIFLRPIIDDFSDIVQRGEAAFGERFRPVQGFRHYGAAVAGERAQ